MSYTYIYYDRVGLDLHVLALGEIAGLSLRTHAKADDDGVGGGGENHVGLGNGTNRRVDDVDAHLGLVHLAERIGERLDGALNISLDDEVKLLELVLVHLIEERLERDVLYLGLLLDAGLERTLVGELLGVTLVLKDAELITGDGHGVEAENLSGVGGTGGVLGLTVLVEHGAHAAKAGAGHHGVAHMERTAVDDHRGHRAAAAIELALEDVARGKGVGVGLELEDVGLE